MTGVQTCALPIFTFYPNVFESLESIAPSGLPFGVSQDRLVEKLGSPAYRLINEKAIPSHTVLFYKKSIDGMVLIYQYHFIESRMFFVSFGILKSRKDEDLIKSDVIKTVYSKYLDAESARLCIGSHGLIRDTTGNVVFIEDHYDFRVNYLCREPGLCEFLNHYLDEQRKGMSHNNDDSVISKLQASV